MTHDLIVVIALAWVFGARMITKRFFTQPEVFQIVLEATGGKCLKTYSILINQSNNHCHSLQFHGDLHKDIDLQEILQQVVGFKVCKAT